MTKNQAVPRSELSLGLGRDMDKGCGTCKFCGYPEEGDPHKGVCKVFEKMKTPFWVEDYQVEVEYDEGQECDAYVPNVKLTGRAEPNP